MESRLFEDVRKTNVEALVNRVNEIVGKKFQLLDEKDDIEKWNKVPKFLMLDEVAQKRLLSFIEYIDSLFIPLESKTILIVSLAGLMEAGNIKLYDYDDGSLYAMADYYQNSSIEEIKETISVIGNKELLLAVRKKTLDLEVRIKLLSDIISRAKEENIKLKDKKMVKPFIENMIKEITEKNYYELVK